MGKSALRISYGPVPSRRLGKSLGINNIPPKVCTYSCIYCQVGRTTQMTSERRVLYEPEEIFLDVQDRLTEAKRAAERVDYLTFVPDGEPTLDLNLGRSITLLKTLGVPVGVISNSSLIWRDDVKEDLGRADWVSLKVDAVEETIWRQINRPHKAIRLPDILEGILAFADTFHGRLATETMLVGEVNDSEDCMKQVGAFLHRLHPYRAYLSVPTRPPAESRVCSPDEATLNRAFQVLADELERVELLIGYEGDAFVLTGHFEKDLLSITAVHPMREEAVRALLSQARSSWDVIERLIARGDLVRTEYDGHVFYLRRLAHVS